MDTTSAMRMNESARCMTTAYRLRVPLGKNEIVGPLDAPDDRATPFGVALRAAMRITGGKFGSRALRAPKGRATRPTTDRVREALFSILVSAGIVEEKARVLDPLRGHRGARPRGALAGRGSRDSRRVVSRGHCLSESECRVAWARTIRPAHHCGGRRARWWTGLYSAGPYDLVLADPPWAMVDGGEAGTALSSLVQSGAVAQTAWVVLEHSSRTDPPDLHGLVRLDQRRYGDTALTFYKPAILAPLRP